MIYDVHAFGTCPFAWTQRVAAHLAFDPSWIAARPTRHNTLFQDFREYSLMERFAVPRGEWTRISRFYDVPREPRGRRIVGRGLGLPSVPPHA